MLFILMLKEHAISQISKRIYPHLSLKAEHKKYIVCKKYGQFCYCMINRFVETGTEDKT